MSRMLYVATARGLYVFERRQGEWHETGGAQRASSFTSIAAQGVNVLAGTREGLFRSADLGQTWWEANEGLTERHVRWLAYHPDDADLCFAGTEPAAIFVSQDGGESWEERPAVAQLRDEHNWNLPYSPAAGCVRGFAFRGTRGYAAVEQGGMLRSDDRGEIWRLVKGCTGDPVMPSDESYVHPDVHSVTLHPTSSDHVFAPTGGGFYQSIDGGDSWSQLYDCYCRAVWVDPDDPGHLVLGPADSVDANGRIEESIDGGRTWEPMMDGLEPVWPRHMVERFCLAGDELLAVLSNGQLVGAGLEEKVWRSILPALQDVRAVATVSQ